MSAKPKKTPRPSLTQLTIPNELGKGIEQLDLSLLHHPPSGHVSVFFRDIEQKLVERIRDADCVFGCVAWLTSEPILDAIAEKSIAQIIIQKEDFLRPDLASGPYFKARLRTLYSEVAGVYRAHFGSDITVSNTWTIMSEAERVEGVRCLGYRKQYHAEIIPVMHHKFLVFCRYQESPDDEFPFGSITPYAAWTGSFNFTRNATLSFENAIFIEDGAIAERYLKEWGQLAALSEPLNWEHDYVAPQYWIGTGT